MQINYFAILVWLLFNFLLLITLVGQPPKVMRVEGYSHRLESLDLDWIGHMIWTIVSIEIIALGRHF